MPNTSLVIFHQPQLNGSLLDYFPHAVLATYVCYGILGLVTFGVNLLVVFTILSSPTLRRREMYPLVALAIGDGTFGSAFVTSFFRRGYLILTGTALDLVSPWYCMTVVHSYLFLTGAIHATLMLVVVSVDRFLAVAYPIVYCNLTGSYTLAVLVLPWAYSQVLFLIGLKISWHLPDKPTKRALCYSESGVSRDFYFGYTMQMQVFAVISVVVYAVVMIVFRRRAKTISSVLMTYHLKRQAKVTKMLSIIALCTTVLFIIPSYVNASKDTLYPKYKAIVVPFTSALQISNSTVNFFVYLCYNRSFREAFVTMCRSKCSRRAPSDTRLAPVSRVFMSSPRNSQELTAGQLLPTIPRTVTNETELEKSTLV